MDWSWHLALSDVLTLVCHIMKPWLGLLLTLQETSEMQHKISLQLFYCKQHMKCMASRFSYAILVKVCYSEYVCVYVIFKFSIPCVKKLVLLSAKKS